MVVRDLLDLAVTPSVRAFHSMQLSSARAGKRLVSVGASGIILLSDDDGKTWRQSVNVPTSVTLTDVYFVDEKTGWAVGHSGVILFTTTGGETWQLQQTGIQIAQSMIEEANALIAAGSEQGEKALRNAKYFVSDGPDKPLLGVYFKDRNTGWAVGAYGLSVLTQDGGSTWTSVMTRVPNVRGMHLYQVRGLGDDLVIVGEQGSVFHSKDGGRNFETIETPYEGSFFGLTIMDDRSILAFGLKGNAWISDENQKQWRKTDLGAPTTVTAGIHMSDGSVMLGDESGRVLRSTDGGQTFQYVGTPAGAGLTAMLQAADGALIVSGTRGNQRIESNRLSAEAQ